MSQPAPPPLRLLIGFAEEDRAQKDEFCKHLAVLQRAGKVEPWSIDQVRAGDNSRAVLDHAISEADLVILLVSSSLLASSGAQDAERLDILARSLAAGKRVIPIILKTCLWRKHPLLHELEPLPAGGKPILVNKGNARDQAYTDVIAAIAKYSSERHAGDSADRQGSHGDADPSGVGRRKRVPVWAAAVAIIALMAIVAAASPWLANTLRPAPTGSPSPTKTASPVPSNSQTFNHEPKHTDTPEAEVHEETGSDNNVPPRRARYEFFILKQAYEWVFESTAVARLNGRDADIRAYILGARFRSHLDCSVGLVGLGLASEEGVDGEEVGRARARAKQLTDWFDEIPNPPPILPLYKYILGKYENTGARIEDKGAKTGWQRKAVIISIIDQQEGVDHQGAALDALKRLGSGWLRADRESDPPKGRIEGYTLYPQFEWLPISTDRPSKVLRPPPGCQRFFP
jgi:hypothetical protein